jgi:hypothetical protein
MAIVFPSEAIARRWNGALQARLRRAPLEEFLRARSLTPAAVGVAQDTDDLIRATVHLVEEGLGLYFSDREGELSRSQYPFIGYLACGVSHSLSTLIVEPPAWRIAALVSSARVLGPWIGVSGAALHAAKIVREYETTHLQRPSRFDAYVRGCVNEPTSAQAAQALERFAVIIARSLALHESNAPIDSGLALLSYAPTRPGRP